MYTTCCYFAYVHGRDHVKVRKVCNKQLLLPCKISLCDCAAEKFMHCMPNSLYYCTYQSHSDLSLAAHS